MNINREPESLTVNLKTCVAANLGVPCCEPPTMIEPVLLCDAHKVQVAAIVVPALLNSALAEVRAAQVGETRAVSPAAAHIIASAQSADVPEDDRHGAMVYFLANGGRVKVGFTKGLVNRLRALSLRDDALLLLLHGGRSLERALHAKFDGYRIGNTEWFELSPEIVRFIASKSPRATIKPLTSGNSAKNLVVEPIGRGSRPAEVDIARARLIYEECRASGVELNDRALSRECRKAGAEVGRTAAARIIREARQAEKANRANKEASDHREERTA